MEVINVIASVEKATVFLRGDVFRTKTSLPSCTCHVRCSKLSQEQLMVQKVQGKLEEAAASTSPP